MTDNRVTIIDTLRGFALLGIVLIHSVEHFELFKAPNSESIFVSSWDIWVFTTTFQLISGKAYSMFAVLFGLSFFIQLSNRSNDLIDFQYLFLRRLLLLFCIGLIHSLIYRGDILHLYAVIGILLVFVHRLNTKILIWLAVLLLLQLPILSQTIYSFIKPNYEYNPYYGGDAFGVGEEIYSSGTLFEVIQFNLLQARVVVLTWTYHVGRFYQLFGLFIVGLILGRTLKIRNLSRYLYKIQGTVVFSLLITVALMSLLQLIKLIGFTDIQVLLLEKLLNSYAALSFTTFLFGAFAYLSIQQWVRLPMIWLAYYGRMSLSNYVFQAVVSVFFFYGFGLGMYQYIGAFWSLIYGLILFISQVIFSKIWLSNYKYGPLEWLWRVLTYGNINLPIRRSSIGSS